MQHVEEDVPWLFRFLPRLYRIASLPVPNSRSPVLHGILPYSPTIRSVIVYKMLSIYIVISLSAICFYFFYWWWYKSGIINTLFFDSFFSIATIVYDRIRSYTFVAFRNVLSVCFTDVFARFLFNEMLLLKLIDISSLLLIIKALILFWKFLILFLLIIFLLIFLGFPWIVKWSELFESFLLLV